jgi:hypothetical protein
MIVMAFGYPFELWIVKRLILLTYNVALTLSHGVQDILCGHFKPFACTGFITSRAVDSSLNAEGSNDVACSHEIAALVIQYAREGLMSYDSNSPCHR